MVHSADILLQVNSVVQNALKRTGRHTHTHTQFEPCWFCHIKYNLCHMATSAATAEREQFAVICQSQHTCARNINAHTAFQKAASTNPEAFR